MSVEDEGDEPLSFFVEAMYTFTSQDKSALSFEAGEVIEVLTQLPSGWWDGILHDARGWFPSNYVRILEDTELYNSQIDLDASDDEDIDLPEDANGVDGQYEQQFHQHHQHHPSDAQAGHHPSQSGLESALSLNTLPYPANGDYSTGNTLTNDIQHLRQLYSEGHPSLDAEAGTNDAFEELAHAAMVDSRNDPTKNGPGTRQSDGKVAFDGSENNRNSDIDLGSMHARSRTGSVPSTRIGSPSQAGPSDRQRHRDSSPMLGPTNSRPRAATGLTPPLAHFNSNYPIRERSASTCTQSNRKAAKESDYWVPRVNDRGEFYYFNTKSQEVASELPEGPDGPELPEFIDDTSSPRPSDEEDAFTGPLPPGQIATIKGGDYFERLTRERRPGLLSSTPGSSSNAKPAALVRDEHETSELQQMLYPSPSKPLSQLAREALEAIGQLEQICAEVVDADGFSEADRKTGSLDQKSGTRLAQASKRVVNIVRPFLYCSGSLDVSATDAATMAELTSLMSADANGNAPSSSANAGSTSAAIAAFAGAVVALNPRNISSAQGTLAVKLRVKGTEVNSLLSKLVLSARAVTEQPLILDNKTDEADPVGRAENINQYRQHVHKDAVDLATAISEALQEIEVAGGAEGEFADQKRLEAALQSAEGSAGVGKGYLGGGSAAGWRGSGFVLPSAKETAAMQAHSSYGTNLLDLPRETQNLLLDGKEHLWRRPSQQLGESVLRDSIGPQLDDLLSLVDRLVGQIRRGVGARMPTMAALSLEEEASGEDDLSPPLEESTAQATLGQLKQIMQRLGTFLALIEDIDMASVLDVDGPSAASDSGAARSSYASLVLSAREGLRRFAGLKQGCHDATSDLFIQAQEVSKIIAGCPGEPQHSQSLLESLRVVKQVSVGLIEVAHDIAQIAEEQSRSRLAYIGARSKIYGVDETMGTATRLFSSTSSLPYQEPSAAIARHSSIGGYPQHNGAGSRAAGEGAGTNSTDSHPASGTTAANEVNGQSSGSRGQRTTSIRSGVSTNSPAIGRNRSASVTTGGSTGSGATSDLSKLATTGRRGTAVDGTTEDDNSFKSPTRTGSKLKKFFGDDIAPLQLSQQTSREPPPSAAPTEASSSTAALSLNKGKSKLDDVPWYMQADYPPEDIVIGEDGKVKGATLNALIEQLTSHRRYDSMFNDTFLMTYRSFTTTEEFLGHMFSRAKLTPPPGLTAEELKEWETSKQGLIRVRIFGALKQWIEGHFYDGEDEKYLPQIRAFAVEMGGSPLMTMPSKQMIRLIERRQGEGEQTVRKMILPTSAPLPLLPKGRKIKFLDIEAVEMARQLTLLESKLYNKIKPMECLGKAWSKPDSDIHAKGIKDTINTSNRITGWVAEAILVQDDLKKRAAWIKQFISIADQCRELNNFSTMTAIVSGLNSAPVYRLKRSWDAVSTRHHTMLEQLNKIMQSSKNFSDYRAMIHKLKPPCVPFLGVYLTDLTFIEDGNSDRLKSDDRLINFGKRSKTAEVIREIMVYQSTPYNLSPVPGIQKFIEDNLVESRGDTELYQQSLNLEPREREDEKISRLLAESGFL